MYHYQDLDYAKEGGVTLLEMLLAISITVALMASITRVYFAVHKHASDLHQLEMHQIASQRVKIILHDEIQRAGQIGCARLSATFPIQSLSSQDINSDNFLAINEAGLHVRYQLFPGVVLKKDMKKGSRLMTDSSVRYHAGQFLMISDCEHAEIFEVGAVVFSQSIQIIYPSKPLHDLFKRHAEIGEYVNARYFINTPNDRSSSTAFSLAREDAFGGTMKLVQGVDDLKLHRDQHGIHYSFATVVASSHRRWYGYAKSEAS